MQTDSTLKYLTRLCAADLLPWLGAPDAQVIEVISPELPATDRRLDNLLRLQEPDGRTSLHLVEWQGYPDPDLFWRVLEYLGLLGRRFHERPIRVTIIYLKPVDDSGDRLDQAAETVGGWGVTFHTLRLWEHAAQAALASGRPGLLAVLPLLAGATADQVVQAAQALLRDTSLPTQNDLLVTLGTLSSGLLSTERFLRLVTKERLMETDLISYLLQDKEAAFAAEKAALEERLNEAAQRQVALEERLVNEAAQRQAALEKRLVNEAAQRQAALEKRLVNEAAQRQAAQQAALCTALQQAVEDAISVRFPAAPLSLTRQIRAIDDPSRLQALIPAVITAPDLAAVAALL